MNSVYFVMGAALLAVILYGWLSRRLTDLFQPLRFDVIETAEELMSDADFPDQLKSVVSATSDLTLSRFAAWSFVVTFPIRAIFARFRKDRKSKVSNLDVAHQKKLRFVLFGGLVCILANSPLAFVLAAVEVVIFQCLLFPVFKAIKSSIGSIPSDPLVRFTSDNGKHA